MCNCKFCKTYDLYRWATIIECGCCCHVDDDVPTGHDSLCCEFPNGLKKNNPYKNLKPASYYKNILDEMLQ